MEMVKKDVKEVEEVQEVKDNPERDWDECARLEMRNRYSLENGIRLAINAHICED